MYELLVIYI